MADIPTRMFCCDPGLMSGVAELSCSPGREVALVSSMECAMSLVGDALEEFLTEYGPSEAEVVVERFTITVKTATNSQAPWSLETIGMVKWLVWKHWDVDPDETVVLQQPADAKRFLDNAALRRLGLWHRGGAGHANDAIRHGVYRYARLGVRE